jgi:hypothetical protein
MDVSGLSPSTISDLSKELRGPLRANDGLSSFMGKQYAGAGGDRH